MRKHLPVVYVTAVLFALAGCRSEPSLPASSSKEKAAPAPDVIEKKQISKDTPAGNLPETILAWLPATTLGVAVIPSLAELEQSTGAGKIISGQFSSERRGLRPLAALKTIGASLDAPETWGKMGFSPRTPMIAALVDQTTLVLALETIDRVRALPRLKMGITALTGTAPTPEKIDGDIVKLSIGNPKVWALLGQNWLAIVLTSGAEEPTDAALALGSEPTVKLSEMEAFKAAYPAPSANRLLNAYVNLSELIQGQLRELRQEKHGSWLYAEKLLAVAIRDDKPDRVINHWRAKVDVERQWSKKNRPGLLAAADALESSTAGIESASGQISLAPYGLQGEMNIMVAPGSQYEKLFPSGHPTSAIEFTHAETALWLTGNIDGNALNDLGKHIPAVPGIISVGELFEKLQSPQPGIAFTIGSKKAESDKEKSTLYWAVDVDTDGTAIPEKTVEEIHRLMRTKDWSNYVKKIESSSVRLANTGALQNRTIEQEGKATWVGNADLRLLGTLLDVSTKMVTPRNDDPVEAAIIEEMNAARKVRDLSLHREKLNLLKAMGSLDFRILPRKSGWQLRIDLNAPQGMKGVVKGWGEFQKNSAGIIEKSAQILADKRIEIQKNKRRGPPAPALP